MRHAHRTLDQQYDIALQRSARPVLYRFGLAASVNSPNKSSLEVHSRRVNEMQAVHFRDGGQEAKCYSAEGSLTSCVSIPIDCMKKGRISLISIEHRFGKLSSL